jgi:hypothetical protein
VVDFPDIESDEFGLGIDEAMPSRQQVCRFVPGNEPLAP